MLIRSEEQLDSEKETSWVLSVSHHYYKNKLLCYVLFFIYMNSEVPFIENLNTQNCSVQCGFASVSTTEAAIPASIFQTTETSTYNIT